MPVVVLGLVRDLETFDASRRQQHVSEGLYYVNIYSGVYMDRGGVCIHLC